MPKWKCEACGNTVVAKEKPPQCPCGSEDITEIEDNGFFGKIRGVLGL